MRCILPSPTATYYPIQLGCIYDAVAAQNLFDNSYLMIHARGLFEKRVYARQCYIVTLFA
jgi:hypothetical protein